MATIRSADDAVDREIDFTKYNLGINSLWSNLTPKATAKNLTPVVDIAALIGGGPDSASESVFDLTKSFLAEGAGGAGADSPDAGMPGSGTGLTSNTQDRATQNATLDSIMGMAVNGVVGAVTNAPTGLMGLLGVMGISPAHALGLDKDSISQRTDDAFAMTMDESLQDEPSFMQAMLAPMAVPTDLPTVTVSVTDEDDTVVDAISPSEDSDNSDPSTDGPEGVGQDPAPGPTGTAGDSGIGDGGVSGDNPGGSQSGSMGGETDGGPGSGESGGEGSGDSGGGEAAGGDGTGGDAGTGDGW